MTGRILVINPNSNRGVTAALDRVVEPLRFADGPQIECTTLDGAPRGIETQRHINEVILPLCDLIQREDNTSDAFIIGCFGDPGLGSARETTSKPVFGICQAGITTALNSGEKVGILTNLEEDINVGMRYMRTLGVDARIAGIEPIGITVTGLDDPKPSRAALCEASIRLRQKGAEVLITGCAGMTPYKNDIEKASGLGVVDPIYAAAAMALGAVMAD
ncbi:MAG: aspartate/glutamate racemase family protein [Alphaproteobacteria bacterium]|jgi:allantoin racemase|nr:Asp/Glu racemase [Rhodospirillaceae bacterium]MDG2483165.1 aspartate/glutamate racemase family protein [Alphaproteobacteria bacterium]MBT6202462.1 Asp/Glu racemase [Rhodospirillaceae bacterium]MBT6511030.1 Asp/Glu racemase [Rhodospirillaceae bacterium]MBT7614064.1 Asp/Glu racemase [Rhodospirillaceae bacterium]